MITILDKIWESLATQIENIRSLPDEVEVYVEDKYRQEVLVSKVDICMNSETLWVDINRGSQVVLVKGDLEDLKSIKDSHIEGEVEYLINDMFIFKKTFKYKNPPINLDFLSR